MKRITWTEVEKLCKKIALQIKKSKFKPKIILAISRGGVVIGRILCDLLDIKTMVTVSVTHYTGINETLTKPKFLYPPPVLPSRKMLVVDDIADSGKTLELVKNVYKNCKTAVLHKKPSSIVKPDYYAEVAQQWIVYPWEVNEK